MFAALNCQSNYSFLQSASHPQELVEQAAALGYQAIALADECSLAGIVKAWQASKHHSIKLLCASRFVLDDGTRLILLAPSRSAYSELCAIISRGRLNSSKGCYTLSLQDIQRLDRECLAVWLAAPNEADCDAQAMALKAHFGDRLRLGVALHCSAQQEQYYREYYALARRHDITMVASPYVAMHCRHRKPLLDTLYAIRLHSTVQALGQQLLVNSEVYLKPLALLQRDYPEALLKESCALAEQCHFSLDELRYQYPDEVVPAGQNASQFLRELTLMGAAQRWPNGTPDTVAAMIEKELGLIAELQYEHYFLTVYDIVQFARNQQILCQGRGSAANSAVCYCLFITEVDPARSQLLFERFISKERDEPPDIDVDFEHERREEVIQYIYRKYGRSRAALAATVITYRRRSAVRDVGKALGLDMQLINHLSRNMAWWDDTAEFSQRLRSAGLDGNSALVQHFIQLLQEILGFPRHLSQHVGGFVISRDPIATLVPQENAAMAERSIIQWDKTDLEAMQLMKIDVLALGMLSALRKSLAYISRHRRTPLRMMDIPPKDEATYTMLCKADSIGVFQIESRAQMTMLPRLQPRCFYDLVIQIAIVRPGPIQGGMVHPFLRRRQGLEKVEYASPELRKVLERTLGVPIFQEQVIQLAMVAAGFSGGEADQLRRAMATWGRNGHLETFKQKLIDGMLERGYNRDFAERLFSQMKGFGAYGFPESHSASFALLAYASAWIKCHHPAEFYCGLMNSQPMGFYSNSQLCQDATRHGVEVRPVCINHSHWDHQLEDDVAPAAIRLGLRIVKGLSRDSAEQLCARREQGLYQSIADFSARVPLNKGEQGSLARADAFHCFNSHRFQSYWQLAESRSSGPLFAQLPARHGALELPSPSEQENIADDYQHTGLSLRRHPLALLRHLPDFKHCRCAAQLRHIEDGRFISVAGLVTCRQRPGSASGVLFITLEDETGNSNIVVWSAVQQQFRQAILQGKILRIKGRLQKSDAGNSEPVIHLVAMQIDDFTPLFKFDSYSHDFH
ncbi:error-prone DNA polymerase [Spongiibacter sp. KMU-166]|uniref:Error-prone DNA polymerase n=1 Tax=Spongiibacter thalassae TaxID=2721624 RepID=A0ABX1GAP3_9GAMM|nr:error-prone DNA polymerase [Spongiibacter thalassae]NKI16235.1 error-prone DNA polymerase [Spongiibacter thalassae]